MKSANQIRFIRCSARMRESVLLLIALAAATLLLDLRARADRAASPPLRRG
jgi:hypothetical protein